MSLMLDTPAVRPLASESGFTILEVVITVLLMSLGLLAAASALESATRTAHSAERQEQLVAWGQREIERLRALPYPELGHVTGTLPTHEDADTEPSDSNPRNPNFYVAAGTANFLVKASYANSMSAPGGGTTAAGEPLVAGGSVVSEETFNVAGTTGRVYRYITQRTEVCTNCETDDSRRVTLAIVPDLTGNRTGPRKPIWLTTIVNDPLARPPGAQAPSPSQPAVTAQPFFLHDVSCQGAGYGLGTEEGQKPTTHATHNTAQTGTSCASAPTPDSMNNVAPVRDGTVPLQDYSNEADLDRTSPEGGLVLRRLGSDCPTTYSAADAPTRKQSIHTWGTPAFSVPFRTPTIGARAAFSFWTQTVDGAGGSATLCFTLRRSDQPTVALASHSYSVDEWPREPTQLSFAFDHGNFEVPAGQRLLLTVSIKAESTTNVALMYDHPDYASLMTLSTTTPLE